VAATLLLIFAFSATPKIFLHNLLANHTDGSSIAGGKMQEFAVASFHCDCENLVVELPYIDNPVHLLLAIGNSYRLFRIKTGNSLSLSPYFIFGFRGPPANS